MHFKLIDSDGLVSSVANEPLISYRGMYQSAIHLFDMASYCLPLYDLDSRDVFSYYPVLGFVASLLAQVKEDIEHPRPGTIEWPDVWRCREGQILVLLKAQNLDRPPVLQRLEKVGKYFELVHAVAAGVQITEDAVTTVAEWCAAEVRLIHVLFEQMAGIEHDDEFFDALWPLEVFGHLEVHVAKYQDDLACGRFNNYRVFVEVFGDQAFAVVNTEIERYKALFEERVPAISEKKRNKLLELIELYSQENSGTSTTTAEAILKKATG